MTFIQHAKKLEVIKYLVQHKQAGTPQQLAKKLDVSERTVQCMVGRLRNNGYPIRYNRLRLTYEAE